MTADRPPLRQSPRADAGLIHRRQALAWAASLAAALVGATALPAIATDTAAADYDAAMADFNRALAGDESAIAPAAAQFRALTAADPAQPAYRAHAGSATCMLANTTLLPWKKLSHVEDGLAMLDKALAQLTPAHDTQRLNSVPVSLLVRFNAASTFGALPGMFNRGERGARLLDDLLKSPLLAEAPAPFRASVWLRAADQAASHQRNDEARQWLQRVAASGAPQQAAQAQAKLKAL